MNPLICLLPYCQKDAAQAERLLSWIAELDRHVPHPCVLVADDAVDRETKVKLNGMAKDVFSFAETIIVKAPAVVGENYHVPAAAMFSAGARQVQECYKWPFLWLEPDCVPLKPGWMSQMAEAYAESPKRFMGAMIELDQPGVPKVHMAGVGIYPNNAYGVLKPYCDGKAHWDMEMAGYVVPRGTNTPLLWHRWGQPKDPPTFKAQKLETDGPNVGTLDMIPSEAVLFHRTKDSGLIDLLRGRLTESAGATPEHIVESVLSEPDQSVDSLVQHNNMVLQQARRGKLGRSKQAA
jgi:hypothetical protein